MEIIQSERFHEGGLCIFKMVSDFFLVIKIETYSRPQGNGVSSDTQGRQEFIWKPEILVNPFTVCVGTTTIQSLEKSQYDFR